MNGIYYAIQKKSSDELTHHKYIKKEKKNGKWRYYYEGKNGKQRDLNIISKVSDVIGEDEQDAFIETFREYDEAKEILKKKQKKNPTSNDAAQARIYADQKKDEAEEAREAYKKTLLGQMKMIEVKATIAYRRGKSWLSKIFG